MQHKENVHYYILCDQQQLYKNPPCLYANFELLLELQNPILYTHKFLRDVIFAVFAGNLLSVKIKSLNFLKQSKCIIM